MLLGIFTNSPENEAVASGNVRLLQTTPSSQTASSSRVLRVLLGWGPSDNPSRKRAFLDRPAITTADELEGSCASGFMVVLHQIGLQDGHHARVGCSQAHEASQGFVTNRTPCLMCARQDALRRLFIDIDAYQKWGQQKLHQLHMVSSTTVSAIHPASVVWSGVAGPHNTCPARLMNPILTKRWSNKWNGIRMSQL